VTSVGRPLWAGAASASPSARVAGLPLIEPSGETTASGLSGPEAEVSNGEIERRNTPALEREQKPGGRRAAAAR
jgi:hypothetical protein